MLPPDTDEVIAWREEQRRKVEARLNEACAVWEKLLSEQSSVRLQDLLEHYPTAHVPWHTHHHSLLKDAAHYGVTVHVYCGYGSIVTCVLHGDNKSTKFSSDCAGCDHMLFECQLKPLLEKIRCAAY